MKSFLSYITRPSGFGRTQWSFWICMVAVMLYGATLVIIDWDKATAIVVGSCFALTTGIVVWGTIKNFREDQRDLSNPKFHRNDITGEGTTRPYWKATGKPIESIDLWYQMTRECSEQEAEIALDRHYVTLMDEFGEYLKSFK